MDSNSKNILTDYLGKYLQERIPITASVELTDRCNLSCIHCYKSKIQKEEMSFAIISDLLEQIADLKTLFLTFTGGEIFLRNDLDKILEKAAALNFGLRLFTNGTLIGKNEWIALISDIKPWMVEISLYGHKADIHDRVTGVEGSFEKTIYSIRKLSERGINLCLKVIWLKENIDHAKEIIDFAAGMKLPLKGAPLVISSLDGSRDPRKHRPSDDQLRRFGELVKNVEGDYNEESLEIADFSFLNNTLCGAGRSTVAINTEGEIKPCIIWPQSAGNIKQHKLRDIWEKSELFEKVRGYRVSDMKDCVGCRFFEKCHFCPAAAVLEGGDILKCFKEALRIAELT